MEFLTIEIEDLPGVGPATVNRLREAGHETIESIAVATVKELAAAASIGETTAEKIIEAARGKLQVGFKSGTQMLEERRNIGRITTGCINLDNLLEGGIETKSICEFFGEYRTGKTQLAHQLCVTVSSPPEEGGLGGTACYIDTEGTFRPERIIHISERFGVDAKVVLDNMSVARAYNSDHQMLLAEQAEKLVKDNNMKLVIVDSLTSHFRAEYVGRGTLSERQQKLNKHIHQLLALAEIHNVALVVTNQVMSRPDILFGDPLAPIGGHIVGHAATTRIYLRKSKGDRRIARIVDSPLLAEGEAVFAIRQTGIEDP